MPHEHLEQVFQVPLALRFSQSDDVHCEASTTQRCPKHVLAVPFVFSLCFCLRFLSQAEKSAMFMVQYAMHRTAVLLQMY